VDFVQDEDAMATRARQRCGVDDVANFLNSVVAGGVQFQNVVASAYFDGFAGIALTTGLATFGILTVEDLGQNACGSGFPGASGARKQIGLAFSPINDSISKGTHHMVLAVQLGELPGAEAAVKGLCGH
jgi:hypothetical protein